MSTSRDRSLSWSPDTPTSTRLHATGGAPVVQPGGDVVVPILAPSGLVAFRSVNGGATWGPVIKVASIFQHTFGGNLRGPFFPRWPSTAPAGSTSAGRTAGSGPAAPATTWC